MSILFGDKEVIVSAPTANKGVSDKKDAPYVAKRGRKRKKNDNVISPAPLEEKE